MGGAGRFVVVRCQSICCCRGSLAFRSLLPNLRIKWESAPAAYGAFFGGVGKRVHFDFAFGAFPLMLVVRRRSGHR